MAGKMETIRSEKALQLDQDENIKISDQCNVMAAGYYQESVVVYSPDILGRAMSVLFWYTNPFAASDSRPLSF